MADIFSPSPVWDPICLIRSRGGQDMAWRPGHWFRQGHGFCAGVTSVIQLNGHNDNRKMLDWLGKASLQLFKGDGEQHILGSVHLDNLGLG